MKHQGKYDCMQTLSLDFCKFTFLYYVMDMQKLGTQVVSVYWLPESKNLQLRIKYCSK